MAYLLLTIAIAIEIGATSLLKLSDGFSRVLPSVGALAGYGLSFFFLAQALRHVPVSIAYAIWAGLGTVGVVAVGATFLGEPLGVVKIAGIALVVAGVVVLNLGGAH